MKSGRELDLLVAEHVMGYPIYHTTDGYIDIQHGKGRRELPEYSTDISAAWEVVEKMKEEFEVLIQTNMKNVYSCSLLEKKSDLRISMFGESAPHAICLAALKAKGADI